MLLPATQLRTLLFALLLAASPALAGETSKAALPDFSGHWKLDPSRSDDPAEKMRELRAARGGEGGGPGGRGGGGHGGGFGGGRGGGGFGGPGGGPGGGFGGPGGGAGGPGGGGRRGPRGGGGPDGAMGGGPPRMVLLPDELTITHQGPVIDCAFPDGNEQKLYTDGREGVRTTLHGDQHLTASWGTGGRLEIEHQLPAPPPPAVAGTDPAAGGPVAGDPGKAPADKAAAEPGERHGRRAMKKAHETWELVADGQRLLVTVELGPADHRIKLVRLYQRAAPDSQEHGAR